MTPHYLLCRLATLAVASLVISPIVLSQQATESKIAQASTAEAYPNTAEGLHRLLKDLLLTAKNGDQAKLRSQIAEMEIPNYENWFTTTFGQEKGESWAGPYGKMLQKDQKEFQDLLVQLSHTEGEFSIQKIDTAKKYDTLAGPLDEYRADWKESAAPKGQEVQHIAEFFFIEGKFRWDSTVQFFPFQKVKTASIVPAKLVKKVQPDYPAEAQEKRIEGTVKLQVIVRKDGSVTVQNVVEGDPVLSPAAIEAVRQWRYEPCLLNGQPIEVQTTIDLVFTLNR